MRALIVEDEKKIRDFLKKNLESACFAVDVASDGEEGLCHALLNEYDIIILDNQLPIKTGSEVCSALRVAQHTTPILILSVIGDSNKKVELLDAGADDYLAKPFSVEELLARVRALLRRPQAIESEIFTFRDLMLDAKKHQVVRANNEIKLTRKEFMLLHYFMKNAGIVLSRGMIMEHVWDMNADPFSNTIESHIVSLRKKISDREQRLIKTVPGMGYKFTE